MTESDEGRWLIYAEVGELLGVSSSAARMFAKQHSWARRTPNAFGEHAQVLVAPDVDVQPRSGLNAVRSGNTREPDQPAQNGHDQVNGTPNMLAVIEGLVTRLREQLAIANQRADQAEERTAEAAERKAIELVKYVIAKAGEQRKRADDALTAERIAQRGRRVRAELDARQQWGLWRRVRVR